MNVELNVLALNIFHFLELNRVKLELIWIPREQNLIADQLSRIIDYDDWGISDKTFVELDSIWGPHSVDRFANHRNKKLNRFNSRFWNPGTETVDCFTVTWKNENNWLVPPPYLIIRCIQHLALSRADGTLLVPEWPSATFWPIIFKNYEKASFVTDIIRLQNPRDFLISASLERSIFNPEKFNSSFLALRITFI